MPDWKNTIQQQLAGLTLEPTREAEIVEELTQHLEDRYQELLRNGIAPVKAYQITLAELSDCDVLVEQLRKVEQQAVQEIIISGAARTNMIADLWQDLCYAIRMLRKNPGFSFIVVLTLSLGIGANTAIFSLVNTAVLRPLPYHNANELVMFYFTNAQGDEEWFVSPAAYQDLKHQSSLFTDTAAWGNNIWPVNLTGDGEPERLQGFQVSGNFFEVLGVAAVQGRTFLPEEERPGNHQVVVISHELWQQRFSSDPEIVERSILLNDASYKVIGVMPADFRFVLKTDIWAPLTLTAAEQTPGQNTLLHKVARLKPGVSTEQVCAEVTNILRPYLNDSAPDMQAVVKPMQTILTGDAPETLFILFAAVGFILLIACANVANLLLARASVRRREFAIRLALGANRWRIVRQLLTESSLIAICGGACGLLLANWCMKFLVNGLLESVAAKNSHVAMLKLDGWALGFTFTLSLLTIILFGLLPALQASQVNLNDALKEGGRSEVQGRRQNRLRSLLVVTEIALAMILLVGAGLMIKSFWQLSHIHRGFETANVLTAKIDLVGNRYKKPEQFVAFYQQLLERVSAIPSVQHAGITNGFLDRGWKIAIAEQPPVPEDDRLLVARHPVSADYFQTMGIALRAGRFFTDHDAKGAPPVVIIDEILAHRYFPDESPIGKHLLAKDALLEIVGVVGATRAWKPYSYGQDKAFPRTYLPYQQEGWQTTMSLMVRGQSGDSMNLIPAIRHELAAIDKDQPIHSFKLLEQSADELLRPERFSTLLLTAFGTLAMLLAALGIYGLISYTVTQRRHEVGIRIALGAQSRDVLKLILKQGLTLILSGVAIGLVASILLTRLMKTMLFGVSATDPVTFVVITVLLITAALLACYLPARRATKVEPMVALHHE